MKYSLFLDLLYKLHGSYENFIQIVKKDIGFIYDVRLDQTIYKNLDLTITNTIIPEYMRALDSSFINGISGINNNIYKKYTYITQYFSNNLINNIFNDEKLFENYLHTYSFFDIFMKYINYDFLDIIYSEYFIKTLQENVRKIGIEKSAISLITTLLNITSDRIIYGNDIYRYVYLNDDTVKDKILTWLKNPSLTDQELKDLLILYYKQIQRTIKKEYNINDIYNVDNVTNLIQQANRTILLDISTTYIFEHLTDIEQQVLIQFLNEFIPQHVKIVLFNLLGEYSNELLNIIDNINIINIIPNYLLNIQGYTYLGFTILQNRKGEI